MTCPHGDDQETCPNCRNLRANLAVARLEERLAAAVATLRELLADEPSARIQEHGTQHVIRETLRAIGVPE